MKRALTFTDGIGVGIGAIGMLALLALAQRSPSFEGMYRETRGALPALTTIVMSTPWRVGAPLALVAAFVLALAMRPHRAVTVVIGVATFGVAAIWLYGLYAPIFSISGNIQG